MKDDAAHERAHAIFDPIVQEYLLRPGVDLGPMFSSQGLRVRGKVFAFVASGGELVVKVPEARAGELDADGTASRMVMRGRTLREWVVAGPEAETQWRPLIADAFAYLDAITP